jgi:hypothetical protein
MARVDQEYNLFQVDSKYILEAVVPLRHATCIVAKIVAHQACLSDSLMPSSVLTRRAVICIGADFVEI